MCLITALSFGVKRQGHYILTISLWLVTRTPPSFFDQWCSNLAQFLLMVCKLQSTLHITAMALESKVDQNMSYSGMFLIEVIHILYNNCQYDI